MIEQYFFNPRFSKDKYAGVSVSSNDIGGQTLEEYFMRESTELKKNVFHAINQYIASNEEQVVIDKGFRIFVRNGTVELYVEGRQDDAATCILPLVDFIQIHSQITQKDKEYRYKYYKF